MIRKFRTINWNYKDYEIKSKNVNPENHGNTLRMSTATITVSTLSMTTMLNSRGSRRIRRATTESTHMTKTSPTLSENDWNPGVATSQTWRSAWFKKNIENIATCFHVDRGECEQGHRLRTPRSREKWLQQNDWNSGGTSITDVTVTLVFGFGETIEKKSRPDHT